MCHETGVGREWGCVPHLSSPSLSWKLSSFFKNVSITFSITLLKIKMKSCEVSKMCFFLKKWKFYLNLRSHEGWIFIHLDHCHSQEQQGPSLRCLALWLEKKKELCTSSCSSVSGLCPISSDCPVRPRRVLQGRDRLEKTWRLEANGQITSRKHRGEHHQPVKCRSFLNNFQWASFASGASTFVALALFCGLFLICCLWKAKAGRRRWKNKERLLTAISTISSPANWSAPARPPVPTTVPAPIARSDWIWTPTLWTNFPHQGSTFQGSRFPSSLLYDENFSRCGFPTCRREAIKMWSFPALSYHRGSPSRFTEIWWDDLM